MSGASATRQTVDSRAFSIMFVLCILWGLQQVAIKSIIADVTPLMQGALRSGVAVALLAAWMRHRSIPILADGGTLRPGLAVGTLFGIEFVCIYLGLQYTNASRMSVFVYLAPPLTALGVHLFVPGERLAPRQWFGIALAFLGIVVAFSDGFLAARGDTAVGDLLGIVAAILWATTTVLIRSSTLSNAPAEKTLLYQLGMSTLLLLVASKALGEAGIVALTAGAIASLAFQSVIVAFVSYLAWFWLLTRYLAGRLAVFSFLTPLFGMTFGVLLLHEPITPLFIVAATMVGMGIALANR
jgi:drug/metabolite transporter (DMT)-like permease